jgi:hypothetical protein
MLLIGLLLALCILRWNLEHFAHLHWTGVTKWAGTWYFYPSEIVYSSGRNLSAGRVVWYPRQLDRGWTQLFDLNLRIQKLTWSLIFYEKYSTSQSYLWFWPSLILGGSVISSFQGQSTNSMYCYIVNQWIPGKEISVTFVIFKLIP